MAKVEGVDKFLSSLKRAIEGVSKAGKKKLSVIVGYSAPYAVYVHEDLTKNHPVGQAKFLEQPARVYEKEIGDIVARSVKAKNGLGEGLLRAGKFLLGKSKELVPVVTGVLRDSGFVEMEGS